MSYHVATHRGSTPRRKDRFEYMQIYSICFAIYLLPVAVRRLVRLSAGEGGQQNSIFGETRRLAASCAAMSFAGL